LEWSKYRLVSNRRAEYNDGRDDDDVLTNEMRDSRVVRRHRVRVGGGGENKVEEKSKERGGKRNAGGSPLLKGLGKFGWGKRGSRDENGGNSTSHPIALGFQCISNWDSGSY
jgi:hypothetical protein